MPKNAIAIDYVLNCPNVFQTSSIMNKLNIFGILSIGLLGLAAALSACANTAQTPITPNTPTPSATATAQPSATPRLVSVETLVPITVVSRPMWSFRLERKPKRFFITPPTDPLAGRQEPALRVETFAEAADWEQFDTETLQAEVSDGAYHISIREPNRLNWGFSTLQAQDFYLEVTAQAPNCQAGDHYGVLFRAQDASNFYLFGISCSGEYRLLRYRENNFELLTNWQASLAIQPKGAPNVLGLRAEGGNIHLYANNQHLGSLSDRLFTSGTIGFYAGTRFGERLKADFSNLSVWSLQQPTATP
jgi:hypothetical protein